MYRFGAVVVRRYRWRERQTNEMEGPKNELDQETLCADPRVRTRTDDDRVRTDSGRGRSGRLRRLPDDGYYNNQFAEHRGWSDLVTGRSRDGGRSAERRARA